MSILNLFRTSQIVCGLVLLLSLGTSFADVGGTANPRYLVQGDKVYDRNTNLTWARCSVGQRWNEGAGCVGVAASFTFDEAQKLGNNVWRVPSEGELSTLIDWTRRADFKKPTIDEMAFPNIDKTLLYYWSSTPEASLGRVVSFIQGDLNHALRSHMYQVRLVQGEFKPFANVMDAANPRYVIRGGTVYDKETNLTWARCSVGQKWKDFNGCVGHRFRLTFDQAQEIMAHRKKGPTLEPSVDDNPTWRLPTIDELGSLIDTKRAADAKRPTIDVVAFPNMDEAQPYYWSSTPADAALGRIINFADGRVDDSPRRRQYVVRMVRDGQ